MNERREGAGRRESDSLPALVVELRTLRGALTDKIDDVVKRDKRRRVQLVILAVSVALDLFLSVAFFVALRFTNDNQRRTDAIVEKLETFDQAALATCQASNEASRLQHQLWQGAIAQAVPDPNQTKEEKIAADLGRLKFLGLLDRTFVQKDCDEG